MIIGAKPRRLQGPKSPKSARVYTVRCVYLYTLDITRAPIYAATMDPIVILVEGLFVLWRYRVEILFAAVTIFLILTAFPDCAGVGGPP